MQQTTLQDRVIKEPWDFFFFFLLEEPLRSKVWNHFQKDRRIRFQAIQDIVEIGLLLDNSTENHLYNKAFINFSYRMRELKNPLKLQSRDGVAAYYDYLIRTVCPDFTELKLASSAIPNRYEEMQKRVR